MHRILALLRASWLSAKSYRLNMMFSFVTLLASAVPLYFVANALQPMMAGAIRGEGKQYFAFLLVGTVALTFVSSALDAIPGAVRGSVSSGSLEAMLTTSAPLGQILVGMSAYGVVWTAVRAIVLLIFGAILGAHLSLVGLGISTLMLLLVCLAYFGLGLCLAAMFLAFRTTGPLPQAIILGSTLFGGVYYPTHVIPSWLERISAVIPLTYGLRGIRRLTLEGAPLSGVWSDLAITAAFAAGTLIVGLWLFRAAFDYSRRSGALAYY